MAKTWTEIDIVRARCLHDVIGLLARSEQLPESQEGMSLESFQAACEHDYKSFIDPRSGGFIRCQKCGKEVDCEGLD